MSELKQFIQCCLDLRSAGCFSCKSVWNCHIKCKQDLSSLLSPPILPRLFDVVREMSLQPPGCGDAMLQATVSLFSPEVNWQQLGRHLTLQAAQGGTKIKYKEYFVIVKISFFLPVNTDVLPESLVHQGFA